MPRTKKPEREANRLKRRNRKFIRKDTVEEYKLRSDMVLVSDRDGMQTYFKPTNLATYQEPPKQKEQPCHYCDSGTLRSGMTVDGETVPMCVGCGIDHDHTPKAPTIRFGENRS